VKQQQWYAQGLAAQQAADAAARQQLEDAYAKIDATPETQAEASAGLHARAAAAGGVQPAGGTGGAIPPK